MAAPWSAWARTSTCTRPRAVPADSTTRPTRRGSNRGHRSCFANRRLGRRSGRRLGRGESRERPGGMVRGALAAGDRRQARDRRARAGTCTSCGSPGHGRDPSRSRAGRVRRARATDELARRGPGWISAVQSRGRAPRDLDRTRDRPRRRRIRREGVGVRARVATARRRRSTRARATVPRGQAVRPAGHAVSGRPDDPCTAREVVARSRRGAGS
jgi:hypothetical protein